MANTQINLKQIAQNGASTNDVIKWNGTNWIPGAASGGADGLAVAIVEGYSGTTVDLDANNGTVKNLAGSNVAFTTPTNLDTLSIYKNGIRLDRSGSTTRDYSVNPSTHVVTFEVALTASDYVTFTKGAIDSGIPPSTSIITPSQITSNQNDYNPSGWETATIIRLSSDSSMPGINGFSSTNIADGHKKTLINIGSNPFYISGNHTGSTAANRIELGRDLMLYPKNTIDIVYDATSQRWRLTSIPNRSNREQFYRFAGGSSTAADWGEIAFHTNGTGATVTTAISTTQPSYSRAYCGTTSTGRAGVHFLKTVNFYGESNRSHIYIESDFSLEQLSNSTNRFIAYNVLSSGVATFAVNSSAGFRYSDDINSGKWQCYVINGSGAITPIDSGITVVANTVYALRVELNKSNNELRFYIDGQFVGAISSGLFANDVLLAGRAGIEKTAGSGTAYARIFSLVGGSYYL